MKKITLLLVVVMALFSISLTACGKKKDDNALSRLNGGRFDDSALTDMVKGLQSIEIPLVPTEIKEVK